MSRWLAGVAIVVGCVLAPLVAQQAPRELFERARMLEESNQNLQQAIALYTQAAAYAAERGQRDLAATAQLRVGLLHDRLGHKDEARRAFRTVISHYADSAEAVVLARGRLDAIQAEAGKPSTALATRQVQTGAFDITGSVSRDGRHLSFTDWDTGDVAIRDVTSGTNRRLTNKGGWQSPAFGEFSLISPDNSQIAYVWCDPPVCEVRLVGRDGGSPRVLYRNADVEYPQPCDWSPDGSQVLAVLTRPDRSNQIALISVSTGSARVLKTLGWGAPPWKMTFSPDGRYIAYEFPPVSGSLKRDLFVLASDGSREQALVEHPANEFLLGWFPNGRHVLFASDRLGANGAWAIAVADGKPAGDPRLLKPAIGKVFGLGFAQNGDYYYSQSMGVRDVFVAALGPDGRVGGAGPRPLDGSEGSRLSGVWSPDGSRIAYLTQTPEIKGDAAKVVSIQTLATHTVQDISLKLNYASNLAWFPDGRALALQGRDARGRGGLFRLDLSTEAIEPLAFDADRLGGISPDGRNLFYQRALTPGVIRRDLVTGEEQVVFASPVTGLDLSWDGRWLAIRTGGPSSAGGAAPPPGIHIVPASGGDSRPLLQLQPSETPGLGRAFSWSRDNKYVLFSRGRELWRVAIDGGRPDKIGTVSFDLGGGSRLSIHPDGRRLAVSGGSSQWQLWVMENLQRVTGS